MEWSRRTKLAEESISCALRLEAPLQPVGHTRHFDPSPSAIAEMIFASSGWRLANFCVNDMSRARPRAGCKRKRSTVPETIVHEDGLTESGCDDPLTKIIGAGAILQLALHGESGL